MHTFLHTQEHEWAYYSNIFLKLVEFHKYQSSYVNSCMNNLQINYVAWQMIADVILHYIGVSHYLWLFKRMKQTIQNKNLTYKITYVTVVLETPDNQQVLLSVKAYASMPWSFNGKTATWLQYLLHTVSFVTLLEDLGSMIMYIRSTFLKTTGSYLG